MSRVYPNFPGASRKIPWTDLPRSNNVHKLKYIYRHGRRSIRAVARRRSIIYPWLLERKVVASITHNLFSFYLFSSLPLVDLNVERRNNLPVHIGKYYTTYIYTIQSVSSVPSSAILHTALNPKDSSHLSTRVERRKTSGFSRHQSNWAFVVK